LGAHILGAFCATFILPKTMFEGSVTDSRSSGNENEFTYGCYDITAEEKNYDVDSLDDIVEFFANEVPEKLAQYETDTTDNEEIEVELDVSGELSSDKLYFTIETNLPDGMVLTLKLTDGDYTAQSQVTVNNGIAASEGFGRTSGEFSGTYTLVIGSTVASLQDESVIDVIGAQGEYLTGKYVSESSLSGSNVISATFEFDI
ncbi:MAG: hypothetical protein LUD79_08810, partial [Oscillospiraceae bacterium]|nr:hypothetical protein [Oscillospiraceae bacterium]